MPKFNKRSLAALKGRFYLINKSAKTNRKIVVLESDDWGSIRTSNLASYNKLKDLGYAVDKSPYMLDALEINDDLSALYDSLNKFRTEISCPKITANIIFANPDFDRIKSDNFEKYHYENVEITCRNSTRSNGVVELWKEGMDAKLFMPQLHGREHVRYWEWMKKLREHEEEVITTFNMNMCGVPIAVSKNKSGYFKPLYVSDDILKEENISLEKLINEGSIMFKDMFGFESESTVAPNVAWTDSTEKLWSLNNIKYIQGGFLQEYHHRKGVKYTAHYLGQRNSYGQTYIVRNCTFEPCRNNNDDYWNDTFKQVKRAFALNTPAVISTHRVNYIGAIKESNRTRGLNQLENLLQAIITKYPDVEFMSTNELGAYLDINNNIKS